MVWVFFWSSGIINCMSVLFCNDKTVQLEVVGDIQAFMDRSATVNHDHL